MPETKSSPRAAGTLAVTRRDPDPVPTSAAEKRAEAGKAALFPKNDSEGTCPECGTEALHLKRHRSIAHGIR